MSVSFPDFKQLTFEDREIIEKFTSRFLPYSDYNFVSLYSYNTEEKVAYSILNNNLIIKFQDYITNEPLYSFIGDHEVEKTIETLFGSKLENESILTLNMLPEIVINSLTSKNKYRIEEDVDNFDYILLIQDIIKLEGNRFRGKRNFLNRFLKKHKDLHFVNLLDISQKSIQEEMVNLFKEWAKTKNKPESETKNELTAFKRFLSLAKNFNIHTTGIYIDNKLAAFTSEEIVQDKYAIVHFEKAHIAFEGIYAYLHQQAAQNLSKLGVTYLNYEQDMGIPGLRNAKKQWLPVHFLKKYILYKN